MGSIVLSWSDLVAQGFVWPTRLPVWRRKLLATLAKSLPKWSEGFWILSSGTNSSTEIKAIGLSHAGFLCAAESVNRFLQSTKRDSWLLALPTDHVGGLSILARCHLSGAKVVQFHGRWNPQGFVRTLTSERSSLTSLVPTQVFDLVKNQMSSPRSLRAVLVGGGFLDFELEQKARALGWPVLRTYGLTELSAMVAGPAENPSFNLQLLPHVKARVKDSRLELQSTACAQFILRLDQSGVRTLEVAAPNGWYRTADCAAIEGSLLKILGRADREVKILGELVSLNEVEQHFRQFLHVQGAPPVEFSFFARRHPRRQHELFLAVETERSLLDLDHVVNEWNAQVSELHRFAAWAWLKNLPRTNLGKVRWQEVEKDLFG